MRERLVSVFVLFAVFIVVIFGVVRAYSLTGIVKADEAQAIDHSIGLLASVVKERADYGKTTTASQLETYLDVRGERIEYLNAEGELTTAQSPTYDSSASKYDLSRSAPVEGGGSLTLERSGAVIDERIANAILPILWLTLGLIATATAVGYVMATRLSRPFQELAQIADGFGRGDFDIEIPRYSIREADAVSRALSSSAIQLKELVRNEREFATNVSHQLRTPITALHLVLEDLAVWDETAPAVAEELRRSVLELDRLSNAVTSLLDIARGKAVVIGPAIDVSELIIDAATRWRPQVTAAERQITAVSSGTVLNRTSKGSVDQILDVLIENSIQHGVGLIALSVTELDTHLRLCVQDQGRSTIDSAAFSRGVQGEHSDGEGIGLSIAADLAKSLGGYLTIGDSATVSFDLMLPRH